jgi:hypothetical protein
MSVARGFGLNGKSIYTNVTKPLVVWCNFIVDSTNGNGWGVRSVKSNGYIEAVFMYTAETPGKQGAYTNPITVAGGNCLIIFKNNFNYYLGGFQGQIIAPTSTSTTSTTAGHAYQITSLGTTTLAQWQAAGLPLGFTPAVNQAFIATATGSIGGTGTVGLPAPIAAFGLTVCGDPNQTISNSNIASNAGAQILTQFSAPTNSSTTTMVSTAPANNTVVAMQFNFDGSYVTIDGL